MPSSTPNRAKSLSLAKAAANARRLSTKRINALVAQVMLASMHNKLPTHLKSPKKNKGKK